MKHKQCFAGLVALGDMLLARGAVQSAYGVYWTRRQYGGNFLLRLKFAEAMRLNGFVSAALKEFAAVYGCFDAADKKFKEKMTVVAGYTLALMTVGDYETATAVLASTNRRDKLVKLAAAHVALQQAHKAGDAEAAKSVLDDVKDDDEKNPLMLALAVRAGKLAGEDTAGAEAKLQVLLASAGKLGGMAEVSVTRVTEAEPPQITPKWRMRRATRSRR